ncbi:shikimate dehydrogenase [Burkholderia ambifaria]|uniref:shikimate dehydrogenase n=1 Tax=Burkholderia ambifaria TaxID=152480 RepID=UPI001B9AF7F2|nr:shikimate dehydrogenase [Burkholderia ambifaria]MBR8332448.1 shikimate dehydrogenase [Burkholderia ambifaria]
MTPASFVTPLATPELPAHDPADTAPLRLGLIGAGIAQSRSPALHEGEAAARGLPCRYALLDLDRLGIGVDGLDGLLRRLEDEGWVGVNITLPCKQAVIPLLDEVAPEAAAIGAVNTVRFAAGRRIGYNTDAHGFGQGFRSGLPGARRERVVQFGAGGAGAATAFALLELGATRLTLVDEVPARAAALAAQLGRHFPACRIDAPEQAEAALGTADGVVNATPVGTARHPGSAVPLDALHAGLWVADVIYAPAETLLLRSARALGCQTLDGTHMLVVQAARAFELFTGCRADVARMLERFRAASAP